MTLSTTSAQYGPSLRTRIVIISRHVRSRGVDELKMLLLMPQKIQHTNTQNSLLARNLDSDLPIHSGYVRYLVSCRDIDN